MSDTEWANNSLRMAIQNMQDAATKPLHVRIEQLEAALRRADDIEHSISAEDWYRERDALLGSSVETGAKHE